MSLISTSSSASASRSVAGALPLLEGVAEEAWMGAWELASAADDSVVASWTTLGVAVG